MRNLRSAGGITRTFAQSGADYHVAGDCLVGPKGPIAPIACMTRRLPHDITNALAASALVLETHLATAADVRAGLETFRHPAHRIEPVATIGGVQWFNDSKATTPHAALTAIRGLDLRSLAAEHTRVKAVVGLGEAGPEVAAAFQGHCPTAVAGSMPEAVTMARAFAVDGDVVLLSPACASFDWYPDGGYPARGDDFKRLVTGLLEKETA
jgi:UDP-N-acetylmuramoylalanine--D-glutamate ligase